jgi:spermidine synthase
VAVTCLLGGASLWQAEAAKAALLQALGPSMAAALAAEAGLALLAFGLPAACMGALFSQLCSDARRAGIGLGACLGANTLGAALAPVVLGVLLLPAFGAKVCLLLLVAGYAVLALRMAAQRSARHDGAWPTAAPAGAALAVALAAAAVWAPPLRFIDQPEGARIVSYREGAQAAVSVVEDAQGVSRLRIDNRQQEGSSHNLLADGRQALLPLLLHPAPRQALFLGLGTGITAATAAGDARLQVDAVELLPEVIAASSHFTAALHPGPPNPRLRLVQADARRYVRATERRYDLIVADNFHPARSGSAALYTVEHFSAVGQRLAPGGVFCQWLPLHQLDLETLRSIVAAFLVAHPQGWAMLATHSLDTPVLGLVARADGRPFDAAALRRRLDSAQLARPAADYGLPDALSVLGRRSAGPAVRALTGPHTARPQRRSVRGSAGCTCRSSTGAASPGSCDA